MYRNQISTSRTATVTARDWFAFQQMTEQEQNVWLDEQWLMVAPEPMEPEADDLPEQWEIEADAADLPYWMVG